MGKKPATPERKAHLNQIKRRSKIERKIEAGTATADERAELERLPKRKGPSAGGRPRKDAAPLHGRGEVDNGPAKAQDANHTGGGDSPASAPADQVESPPPPPPPVGFPIPEPPPAVEVMPRSGGDWRGKYRQSMGREGTCVQIALMYSGLLKRMARYVESEGGKPVMTADQIDQLVFPCAVLTADAFLPADFEMRPEHEVTIYSGLIMGQAGMRALAARKRGPRSPEGTGQRRVVVPPPPPEPPPHSNGVKPRDDTPDPAAPREPPVVNVVIDDDSRF